MKHALRLFKAPNASAPARSLTSAIVDMGNPNRRLDSSGFVHVRKEIVAPFAGISPGGINCGCGAHVLFTFLTAWMPPAHLCRYRWPLRCLS